MGKNYSEPLALMTNHKLGTIMTKLRVVASYGGCHLEAACKYGNKRAPGAGQREEKGWADGVWVDREGAMHVVNSLKCKNIWEIK